MMSYWHGRIVADCAARRYQSMASFTETKYTYSVDPAIKDTTIKRTQVREIYSSVKRSGR